MSINRPDRTDRFLSDFDRDFRRVQKAAIFTIIASWVIGILSLAFVGWLIYVLLGHFGVIG